MSSESWLIVSGNAVKWLLYTKRELCQIMMENRKAALGSGHGKLRQRCPQWLHPLYTTYERYGSALMLDGIEPVTDSPPTFRPTT